MSPLLPEPGQHTPGLAQGSASPQPAPLVDKGDKGWDRCFTNLLVYTATNEGEISSSAPWARKLSQRTVEEHKIPALAQPNPEGDACPHPQLLKAAPGRTESAGSYLQKGRAAALLLVLSSLGDPNGLCFGD